MKKIFKGLLTLTCFLFALNSFSQSTHSNNSVRLKGKVLVIHCYKGGAEPDKDLISELSKPVPFINDELFLKKTYYGDMSYIIKTDSAGNFDLDIKSGLYNIYFSNENASSKKMIDSSDYKSTCEEQYKTQSHGQLKVYRKGNSPIEITIRETLNPCGPLPLSAEPKQN